MHKEEEGAVDRVVDKRADRCGDQRAPRNKSQHDHDCEHQRERGQRVRHALRPLHGQPRVSRCGGTSIHIRDSGVTLEHRCRRSRALACDLDVVGDKVPMMLGVGEVHRWCGCSKGGTQRDSGRIGRRHNPLEKRDGGRYLVQVACSGSHGDRRPG